MKKGFSLIELLVVLVIISIFTAFVGPKVAGTLTNMGLKTAAKKVAASLRYARSQAITESIPYVALLDLNENRLTVKPEEASSNEEGETEGKTLENTKAVTKVYVLPEGVRFEKAVAFDGEESDSRFFAVVFMPSGCSSGGTLLLENRRERRYTIKIDFITGMVGIEAA